MSFKSDEWLLALLDEKSPDEFTPAELAALRERCAASPALRRAVAMHLRFEEALHATFGEPAVSAESILRRAAARRRSRLAGVLIATLLLIAAGGFWWLAQRPAPKPNKVAAVPGAVDASRPDEKLVTPETPPVEAARPDRFIPDFDRRSQPPAPPTKVASEPAPWDAVLGNDAPIVPFQESAFAPFGETVPGSEVVDEFSAAALTQWLASVSGQPLNVTEGQWRGKRFAGLEGLARLAPSWRDDAVLHIAPFDVAEFALHLWSGRDGVTIRFYPHQRPQLLAAYAVTREAAAPTPKTHRLLATDGGTYSRASAGAIELRHQDGKLVVTRGALPLLVVPSETPQEVILDGRMKLRTLAMYRGTPARLPDPPTRRQMLAEASPDRLEWLTSEQPHATIAKTDGRVTLSSTAPALPDGPRTAWAAFRLPDAATGLCEAVFRIESLAPGTGVYLGDAEGRPIQALFVAENTPVDTPVLVSGGTIRDGNLADPRWRWDVDPKQELAPAVGPGSWVKLVLGPGGLKSLVSADGEHWGPAFRSPERNARGPFASIGLLAIADGQPRSLTVSAIEVRELTGLAAAAGPELRHRVPAFDEKPPARPADWLSWVESSRPGEVPLDDWLRACAVETLRRGAADDLAQFLIEGLARDAVDSDRAPRDVLALLHDAALLADLWNDQARSFADHYDRLARRIAERGGDQPAVAADLAAVAEGYLTSPIWTESRPWAVPPAAARNLVASAAWSPGEGPAAASRSVAAYLTPAHPEGGWATEDEPGLARTLTWSAQSATEAGPLRGRFAWRHPLATEPGREGVTIAAELQAALDAGAYDDAATLLASIAESPGLVPAIGDPHRFLPAAGLIAEAAETHPALVTALSEQFGATGLLHVRQAAAGDEQAVRAAAVRLFGTAAAAEARRWLGEAALSAGRFAEAEAHFSAALSTSSEQERHAMTARRQLAAALSGNETTGSPGEAVTFGPHTLDPREFEQLVVELRQAHAADSAASEEAAAPVPTPVAVAPQARGRFEDDVGRNPGRGEYRRFDWVGRQIGVTLDRGIAYLTNRFQLVAFDPKRGMPWWTVGLGGEQGEAHALPNVAFTPVVHGDRLYVRRLSGRAPELACHAIKDGGKLVWRSEAELAFASDPVFDDGRLMAVTYPIGGRTSGPVALSLTRFRLDDGTVIATAPLVVLHTEQDQKPSAQLVPTGDGFLVTAAGTAARCDETGGLTWLRKLPHLSAADDPDADRLSPDPLVLAGDRLFLASPGSRAITSLDAATGRIRWTRPLGELERFYGVAGPVLVVRLADRLLGLNPDTGETRWEFHRLGLLEGLLCDEDTVLATSRTELEDRQDALSLLRLDAATGELTSEQIVRIQRQEEIRCGPLFVHDDIVWGFVGEGWREPARTLVEFTRDKSRPASRPAASSGSLAEWLSHVEPQTALNTAAVLPGWTAAGAQGGKGAGFRDEFRGEQWVLFTQAGRDRATRFVCRVDVEPGQKLVAHVGRDDDEGWSLRLLADGETVASEPINMQTAADGWRTVSFDLAPFAGRHVTLAVDQAPPAGKPDKSTKAYWKSLAVERRGNEPTNDSNPNE